MTKIGRPTMRTVALDEALLIWVSEAKTIRAFCREHKISPASIYSWVSDDPSFSERLARAKECAAQMLEDEIMDIADTPTDLDQDVHHRKLQCWAREKRLVWNNPGRYGSKVQLGGAADLPAIEMTDIDRAKRIRQLLDKAKPLIQVEEDVDE